MLLGSLRGLNLPHVLAQNAPLSPAAAGWLEPALGGLVVAAAGVLAVLMLVEWRRRREFLQAPGVGLALAVFLAGTAASHALQLLARGGAGPARLLVEGAAALGGWVAVGLLVRHGMRAAGRPGAAELERNSRELQAENTRLRASAEMFRALMDNSPLRCWICDADGVYAYSNRPNDAYMAVAGGIAGRRVVEIFPAELAQQFLESDRVVLRAGKGPVQPVTARVGTSEFEIFKFPVRAADGREMVAGLALDVTDHRLALADLQEKSRLLSSVTEALRVYLEKGDWKTAHGLLLQGALQQTHSQYGCVGVVLDGLRLRVLAEHGMPWEEHLGAAEGGRARHELATRGYCDLRAKESLLGRVVASAEVVIANPPAAWPAGEPPGSHSFLGVPVRREQKVVGVVAVANRPGGYDLLSQTQLETLVQQAGVLCDSYRRALREESLEEQVRVSQKMEAVGLLAGGVAHDFNNLLQVIKGYTAMAQDTATPWPERHASLEQVRIAGERAAQLTQQLLAFGRQQTLQKVDLDLNQAVKDLLRMIRRVIGEQITVDFIPGHDLGNILADRAQIDQVLLNLCLNARDALPEGGRITIETENVLVNGAFRESHPWAKPGRYVLVTVSDNGIGMDRETVSRIFEPFFTTKPKDKGTGLGLAVVYGVVKQHDGLVHVYSEPGKGTTFKIYLPIVERAASAVGPKHTPSHPRGSETVLLAEDEPMVRELAHRILTRSGYRVLVANDGAEACAIFAMHADQIALLILDVVMPTLGGREAYEKISRQRAGVPVIFCSGYAGSALGADPGLAAGAKLLSKPYGADELLEGVRAALDRR